MSSSRSKRPSNASASTRVGSGAGDGSSVGVATTGDSADDPASAASRGSWVWPDCELLPPVQETKRPKRSIAKTLSMARTLTRLRDVGQDSWTPTRKHQQRRLQTRLAGFGTKRPPVRIWAPRPLFSYLETPSSEGVYGERPRVCSRFAHGRKEGAAGSCDGCCSSTCPDASFSSPRSRTLTLGQGARLS